MIKDLIHKYKEWKNWKKPESNTDWHFNQRGSFHLYYRDGTMGIFIGNGISQVDHLISLDKEDVEYFYNKYSKKLVEEMESEIAKVKSKYENT